MSSRADAKKYRIFCNHMREAIIDERKASPDYAKLIRQAQPFVFANEVEDVVHPILRDERGHKGKLTALYRKVCKRRPVLRAMGGEEIDPSMYGAVITSKGVYTHKRRRRR